MKYIMKNRKKIILVDMEKNFYFLNVLLLNNWNGPLY